MVLKRKLPSAMATETEQTKKEDVKAPSSAPMVEEHKENKAEKETKTPEITQTPKAEKVGSPFDADEIPEKTPLAPEPSIESSASAIPNKMSEKEETSEETLQSWDEEPKDAEGWELEGFDEPVEDDIFGSMAEEAKNEQKEELDKDMLLPPWQQGAVAGEAPELPGTRETNNIEDTKTTVTSIDKSKPLGAVVAIVLLVAIGFAGYTFFVEKDDTTEVISRWTGSLNEVSEEIPTTVDEGNQSEKTNSVLQPETIISMEEESKSIPEETPAVTIEAEMEEVETLLPMEDEIEPEKPVEMVQKEKIVAEGTETESQTVVEFVNVPEEEVEKPITAEDAPEMPKEVGVIVQLQQAITEARKQKDPDNYKTLETTQIVVEETKEEVAVAEILSPEEMDERNKELSRQLEQELAEYRRILSGESEYTESARKPTPGEFFDKQESDAIATPETGSIPLPERRSSLLSQKQAESLYGANPYNLPVVPEPAQAEDTGVRTLDDFDVAMFKVEREHVRIPKNIRPSFRATNFPALILLSTVPTKGIIAELDGKQGVLLVGESVSGWELITVKKEYAEFSNGKRKHIVTIGR